ncbi:hypothetical protein Tco_0560968 [Tanacetum coccineum]
MHNNIMAAGSRDRPPMLAPGRYAQWRSRFMRYIDTKDNSEALKKCLEEGPYAPSTVIIPANLANQNTSDELKSITAHKMWISIERLQQGESLNVQDVKTNLFWEFGKFTS